MPGLYGIDNQNVDFYMHFPMSVNDAIVVRFCHFLSIIPAIKT